jgi:hypothetical protein
MLARVEHRRARLQQENRRLQRRLLMMIWICSETMTMR